MTLYVLTHACHPSPAPSQRGWSVKGDLVSFGARKGGEGGMDVDGGEGGAGGSLSLIQNTLMYAKELERIV